MSRRLEAALVAGIVLVGTVPAGAAARAYVSYGCYGCPAGVAVIDTGTNAVIANVAFPIGSEPQGVAVHPNGHRVYVALYRGTGVAVLDATTNTQVATIFISSAPAWTDGVAVSPDGARLYVTRGPQPSAVPAPIVVADTAANTVIATGPDALIAPRGIDVLPDGAFVYVGQYGGAGNVWEISTTTNAVTSTTAGVGTLNGLAALPSGARVYAADWQNNRVRAVDTTTHAVVATIATGTKPWGVAVNPTGSHVYVATNTGGSVEAIDTSTDTVVSTLGLGTQPQGIAVTPGGTRLYVCNTSASTVSVVDTTAGLSLVTTITVAGPPRAFGRFIGPDATCGNGVGEGPEACDDGNTADGDCCSSACAFEGAGSPCPDDGDDCTADTCDGAGTCQHTGPVCVDEPVDGVKLLLTRSASGAEKLVVVSKDPDLLFPAIGGSDDPASSTPGGMTIDLVSASEGVARLTIPPGVSTPPGWKVKDATVDLYKWGNPAAPGGLSPVKVAVLKEGRLAKVVAKAVGLPLAAPQGSVAVRLRTGVLRSCALFDAATVRVDVAGKFVAKLAQASSLADCADATLGVP